MNKSVWSEIADLTDNVAESDFADRVFNLLNGLADMAHFGVYLYDDALLEPPRLALYSGKITDYWMKAITTRFSHYPVSRKIIADKKQALRNKNKVDGGYVYKPDLKHNPDVLELYQKSNIGEKFYYLRLCHDVIYQLNIYRALNKGAFSKKEVARLQEVAPVIVNLIRLRLRFCTVDDFQKRPDQYMVSYLKARGLTCFQTLSKRETEVCDSIASGLTTEGIAKQLKISLASVKTLRNRAYKKLNISSKSELFVILVNSQKY